MEEESYTSDRISISILQDFMQQRVNSMCIIEINITEGEGFVICPIPGMKILQMIKNHWEEYCFTMLYCTGKIVIICFPERKISPLLVSNERVSLTNTTLDDSSPFVSLVLTLTDFLSVAPLANTLPWEINFTDWHGSIDDWVIFLKLNQIIEWIVLRNNYSLPSLALLKINSGNIFVLTQL